MENLSFRILSDDDRDAVVEILQKFFIPFEPMCVAADIQAEEEKAFPTVIIKNALWQGVSIGVFDGDKLCAVRINMLAKNAGLLPHEDLEEMHSEKQQAVHRLLQTVKGSDVSKLLGTKNYMEHVFVTVSKDYARRGIASELYKRSEELAAQNGCEKMVGTCSNYFTKLSTAKAGYKTLRELPYDEYVDEVTGRKLFATVNSPHTSIALVVKDVNPNCQRIRS